MSTLKVTNIQNESSTSVNLVLDSAGKVGVGTSTFTSKLEVYGGNIKVAGTGVGYVFPDGSLQTTAVAASSTSVVPNSVVERDASGDISANNVTAATGLTVTAGGGYIEGNLTVTGNLFLGGNVNVTASNVLVVEDPMIYVGNENPANLVDLGVVASYTDGTYKHTGLVRNHNTGTWTLVDNLVTEPSDTVNWAQAGLAYANLKTGNITVSGTGKGILFQDGTFQTTAAFATPPGGTNRAVQFNDSGVFGGDLAKFSFDTNGNVGIGTSVPLALLDVRGDAKVNGLTVGRGGNISIESNTALGYQSLYNATGGYNSAFGYKSLYAVTTGTFNHGFGHGAGNAITTGSKNVILGSYTGNAGGLDITTSDNYVVLSDGAGNIRQIIDSNGNVGISTTSSAVKLHVQGTGRFTGALTLDTALGVASGGTGLTSLGTGVTTALGNNTNTNGGVVVPTTALAQYSLVVGGGSGTGPSVIATGTAGQHLTSGGAGANPSWTTATFPSTGGTSGTILRSNGTDWVNSTVTYVDSGTSGGIPYYSSTSAISSSAALAANALVVGGGAGVAPSTVTTGTGVVTALGVNTGSAGAFVVNGGALGTPSSGTLTSCTGLPVSTGISGLGTNVATWLATPTSANLASVVSDETGSGSLVFGTSPTFTTSATIPLVYGGTAASSTLTLQSTSGVGTSDRIAFKVGNAGATTAMTINTNGNVGIGTATPTTPLHVMGNLNITGSYLVNGATLSSGATITDDTTTNANTYYPAMAYNQTSGTYTTAYTSSTKLYFNPSTGTLNATVFNSLSDVTFKENVTTIDNALNIIENLRGVAFNWIDNGKKSYGVTAQEIETVLPDIVASHTETGAKSVNYQAIIGFLIEAVKDLSREVKDLKSKN